MVWRDSIWGGGGTALAGDPLRKSTIGSTAGGATVPANTALPADRGTIVITPGAAAEVQITGTAAEPGDIVLHTFGGSFVGFPTNPANRRGSGRVVSSGVIALALSSTNPDGTPSSWVVYK